ncbi:prenyltransferase/squalene oxidase repeat-containing protein [Paraclostridium bifermentans]|uniref:Prenyltransferase/squalene oxidase repeat-containing protein n=1 Tax=Paraclostridium bifermentans TaxID=1490 RepID=A0ABY8R0Y3_PARBF|nr:prenyltransferase/squalene oxidase repeat-containing protein [Paraclostridium bifermentans]
MIDPTLINQRIELGLDWVTSNQNQDGSFGTLYPILNTSLVVLELEQYAISLGVDPLDIEYKYYSQLISGLEYIFSNSKSNSYGIYYEEDENINYTTGVVLVAICSSQSPNTIISTGPYFIQGLTYKSLAQYIVNYLTYSQEPDGGWGYSINNYDNVANNYVSGYVGLGILFATSPLYDFNLSISSDLIQNFTTWVNYIQNDNGGSGYSKPNEDIDILKTGNLLIEMNLLKFSQTDNVVISASNYIANTWYEPACFMCPGWNANPANYQATYALMSGLTGYGFSQINQTVYPFNQIDYIDDVTTVLIEQQNSDGSFDPVPYDFQQSDKMLSTIWALLTLQAALTSSDNIIIELSSDKSSVRQNDIVKYTVRVSNIGNINVFNSIIKDEIPSALSFIEGSVIIDGVPQPIEVSPITGIPINSVNIGKVRVISFKCKVLASTDTVIDNVSSIVFDYFQPYGITIQTQTNYSNVVSIKCIILRGIGITGELNKITAVVGEILNYTIDITNNSDGPYYNTNVIASLDSNLQYMNNLKINGIAKAGNITTGVNLGTLSAGSVTVIKFDAKVVSVPPSGIISTQITVNYDNNKSSSIEQLQLAAHKSADRIKSKISESVTTTIDIEVIVVDSKVSVSKQCSSTLIQIGETATYDIEIVNSGELSSISTLLTDIFPPELQVIEIKADGNVISGDASVGIKLGSISSGDKKIVSIVVKAVGAIDEYLNNSIITMKFLPIIEGEISTLILNAISNNTLSVAGPKLMLTQFIFPTAVKIYEEVIIEIRAKNTGSSTIQNVVVTNLLPTSLKYVPCSLCINGCNSMYESISCGIYLGTIHPEQEFIIQFKAQLIDDSFDPIYNFSQANFYYNNSANLIVRGYVNSNLAYLFID